MRNGVVVHDCMSPRSVMQPLDNTTCPHGDEPYPSCSCKRAPGALPKLSQPRWRGSRALRVLRDMSRGNTTRHRMKRRCPTPSTPQGLRAHHQRSHPQQHDKSPSRKVSQPRKLLGFLRGMVVSLLTCSAVRLGAPPPRCTTSIVPATPTSVPHALLRASRPKAGTQPRGSPMTESSSVGSGGGGVAEERKSETRSSRVRSFRGGKTSGGAGLDGTGGRW